MKRFILVIALALCSSSTLLAEEKRTDNKSFEITPTASPVPALKYQLLFDNYVARRTGNAAIFYFRACLFQSDALNKMTFDALDAYNKGDVEAIRKGGDYIGREAVLNELDLAARCSECDWQDPLHDFGYKTFLPQLSDLRVLGTWLKVRGLYEVLNGHTEEALRIVRLGYEMSRKISVEPVVVSGLVSLAITRDMDEVLAKLMNSPQAPNLYWALRQMPEQRIILHNDTGLERLSPAWAIPQLAKVLDDQEITPAQWNEVFKTMRDIIAINQGSGKYAEKYAKGTGTATHSVDSIVRDSSPEMLQQARSEYAKRHDLPASDTNNIDATQALGEFYFLSFVNIYDELYKLTGLPYPQLLPRTKKFENEVWSNFEASQPANLFGKTEPKIGAERFAFTDRQIAALATVQAISAYAATNQNRLPTKLADIMDTPVPTNPETGLPFEYKVDGDHAVLADSVSEGPLEYTVKLRK